MSTDFAREKKNYFTGYARRKSADVENLCITAAWSSTFEPCYQY
jgi:hypothetical protein